MSLDKIPDTLMFVLIASLMYDFQKTETIVITSEFPVSINDFHTSVK
jgi:hypothetical protein